MINFVKNDDIAGCVFIIEFYIILKYCLRKVQGVVLNGIQEKCYEIVNIWGEQFLLLSCGYFSL